MDTKQKSLTKKKDMLQKTMEIHYFQLSDEKNKKTSVALNAADVFLFLDML